MLRQSLYWRSVAGAWSPRAVPHGRPTEARLLVRRWEGAGRRWRSRLGDRVYFNGTGRPPRSRGTAPRSLCQILRGYAGSWRDRGEKIALTKSIAVRVAASALPSRTGTTIFTSEVSLRW